MFFLPKPYDDELIYSVLARYLYGWGYRHKHELLSHIYGGSVPTFAVELPAGIHALCSAMHDSCALSARDLLQRHTLLPYYLALLDPVTVREVVKLALNDQIYEVRRRLHFGRANLCTPEWFRFCPDCLNEDYRKHGESYWRRTHQLPGVVVCLKHNAPLYRSSVRQRMATMVDIRAPSRRICIATSSTQEIGTGDRNVDQYVGQHSIALLSKTLGRTAYISPDGYRRLIRERGFRIKSGRVAASSLQSAIEAHFRESSLQSVLPHSKRDGVHVGWWALYRDSSVSSYPIQHVLLRLFVSQSTRL